MTALEVLAHIRRLGGRVSVDGDRLRVNGPKGMLTPELREELARHKAEILQLLGETRERDERTRSAPSRIPRTGDLPLSFAQQRLWFLQQLIPDNSSFNVTFAFRLQGELDVPALEQAMTQLVERHEVLRTTFVERAGTPVQVIQDVRPVSIPVAEADREPREAPLAAASRAAWAQARRPFVLERETPLRVRLWRLHEDDHLLLVVVHHIGMDAWSLGVLDRDLAALYDACRHGGRADLAELPVQYADYAHWQRQELRGKTLDDLLGHWSSTLSGVEPLDLPIDRTRPAHQTFQGARERTSLDAPVAHALEQVGRGAGCSLFMTALAAFTVLLRRYSRQDDVAVGTPAIHRGRPEFEGLIGCFLNMLVLRTDLSGDPTFRQLLERVRDVTVGALGHQALPFERLVEELVPDRDPSRHPLFQAYFTVSPAATQSLELPGLDVSRIELDSQRTNFDLSVEVTPLEDGLRVTFAYNTDLFDAATVRGMATAYRSIVEAIVREPETRLSAIPLLSDLDRDRLLPAAAGRDVPGDTRGGLIHRLFETQAAKTPDAIAVGLQGTQLTYRELNGRARRLAAALVRQGVEPGVLVGLCVERGTELLVGTLGILKAGGAYVPLDPALPRERLAFMLEDTAAPVLVTQERLRALLPEHDARLVVLNALPDDATDAVDARAREVTPDDLAYVIFTSGSTGRPKGVQVRHAGAVNFLHSMAHEPGLGPADVLLAVTTLSFDIAALELFLPLSVGARVEIASREVAADGALLARTLTECGITVMQATPATWQMLLHAGWEGDGRLKMLCGGEELPRPLADALLARGGELWNLYGPTETTIWSAVTRVEPSPADAPVSIGQPIANTQLLVLDEHLVPVPRGAPGELHISGAGLAAGYLNRPELTRERFVESPWPDRVPGRLYKTGDLVRYDGQGRLRFLGRMDHQVKLRGFRIELGEIESAIGQHPAVRQAAAIVREDSPGDRRLVAYVTLSAAGTVTSSELREFLHERLPEYMLPGAFVVLDVLPLSPAGKLDRRQLAALEPPRGDEAADRTAPRGPAEEAVAGAFRELLGREDFGLHDDFFELGGHSLLATQLVSRLRRILQVELPLSVVFDAPTVAGLAERAGSLRGRSARSAVEPIPTVPRERGVPLSFAQRRLWFLDQMGTGAAYHMQLALDLDGLLDTASLGLALGDLVARHEVLRTRYAVVDGEPLQVVEPPRQLPLGLVDRSDVDADGRDATVQELIFDEARRPFDLERGEVLRATLVRLGSDEHTLIVTIHHIVADGWSFGLLSQGIAAHYRARVTGEADALPALPVQYADYAAWQRARMTGDVLAEHLAYWRDRLGRDLPVLELPTDRPRPATQTFHGASRRFAVDDTLADGLRKLSHVHGVTLATVCLAAFDVLLARFSRQDDIVVGSPVAGRSRTEIEHLIGLFVNSVVLRTDLSGDPPFSELLRRVHETALAAYDHQDLPFEALVDELEPERDPSRSPLFQVVFAMQYGAPTEVDVPGLDIRPRPFEVDSTRHDLELYVFDRPRGLSGRIVYNTDLFDTATIMRMLEHYLRLLESALDDPGAPITMLPMMRDAERTEVLDTWNGTDLPFARDRCIHELVEDRVDEAPASTALVFEDTQLTYGELEARANRIAHVLRAMGVGRDVMVGLCVDRGLDMIAGLLGILKAGGAYVPIDAAYPRDRIAFMLEDSQASVLVTQSHLLETFPETGARVLCLDMDAERIDAAPETRPELITTADDLAYVIYTSGSTGRPKGVLVEHCGLCHLVATVQIEAFGIRADSRVLQFASLSFDASVSEIFTALVSGATLVLAEPDVLLPGPELIDLMRAQRVTTVTLTPSVLRNLPDADLPDLETIVSAGEACSADLVRRWASTARFINAYGPTEITVCATLGTCDPASERAPSIGRPIANARVYVLDRAMRPTPVGAVGELYVGGPGVARGYLNAPALTAERFVPDPFGGGSARLYRTGDLARFRADGTIDYVGRADHQVKVRGYRIEPGEVEAALQEHQDVRDVVVVKRDVARPIDRAPREPEERARTIELWPSVAEFFVYDEVLYHAMTHDERRNDAYRAAINAIVPDRVVLDIGTGADAILSRLCVEGGARKVYAIELLDESYRAAKATIERLGLQDRIHLIHGNAMEVELPERVDVCVSEIVGAIGGSEGAAAIINDAWRFMKDGGVMIPDRSRTMIAAIVLPDDFVERPAFNKAGAGYVERVFEQVGYRFDLRLCLKNLVRDDIVSSVGCFEDLDYMRPIELETEHAIELRVHRDGRVNGFLVWLTLQTMPGYEIDILDHEYCWLPVFLPVFHPPIEVSRGDVIRARITRTPCENGLNPDYRLAGAVQRSAGPDVPFEYTAHHFRRVYRQTPFYEELFRDDAVPSRAPALTPAGRGAPDTTYESQLVAYVVDDVHWSPGNDEPDVGQSDLVEHWRSLYEDTYGETSRSAPDPTFNLAGWNSSFDGEPIPADEMREWVEQTVEHIREQQPRHVLELGCGSGLLLYRIAPHCERYVGTDFSHAAVDSIARYIGSNGAFANVALRQGAADEIVAGTDERFDTIVLNSVVRYFPDAEYLATVLAGAAGRLEPGGRIFVGDVRNLALLRAFHTAVQLHGVPDDLDLHRLRQRIDHHLNQDQELVVDPAFFLAMRERIPSVTSVEIRPKRGVYDNELSRYRYDVVLHVGGAAPPAPDGNAVDWRRDDLTLEALRDRLRDAAPETLVLTGVPNARNERDVIAVERTGDAEIADVAALRRAIDDEFTASPGVDPEALRALAHDLGYAIAIDLTAGRSDGSFDVVLHRAGSGPMPAITPTARHTADLSTLTNDPLRGRRLRHLVPALREHARNRLPEYMVPAAFVLLDALPVTPNGKIDRRALPAPETLRSDLASAYAEPSTPAEVALATAWAQVLDLDQVGIHDNFFELGGDSIQSVQVVAAAREAGVRITARDLFQHQTVAALAAVATPIEGRAAPEDEPVVGDVPLGPIQRWFVEQELAAPHHFNQTVLLQARDPVDPDALREVLDAIIGHHDALRLRLVRTDDGTWRQHVVETEAVALEYIDLGPVPAGERTALITKRSSEIQSQLDLADGPIIRAALFQADDEPRDRLLLAIHHIAVDGVSWRVLIEDLQRGLEQRRAGKAVALPPRTTSIRTWVERLREHADSAEFAAQAAHWLDQPWASVDPIPCDHAATADADTIGTAENIVVALSPSQTSALLRDVPAAYGTRINDVLLAALVRAMALWTGCDTVLVDLEGHGRRPLFDEIDLSRTVGWFTAIHPLLLRVPGARDEDWDPGASLKIVKECLRTVPSDGIPFGIASYLAADPAITEPFRAIPSAPIAFNYLGQLDSTWGRDAAFAMSSISPGPSHAAQNRREHRLEINGAVRDGALRTTWTYSPAHHDRSTIEAVAENYTTALDAIITHCAAPDAGGFTPSDFEELDVGHDELQDILAEIEQGEA